MLETISLLCSYKNLDISYIVICKDKKVLFSSKFWRVDKANTIYVDKLVKTLYFFSVNYNYISLTLFLFDNYNK